MGVETGMSLTRLCTFFAFEFDKFLTPKALLRLKLFFVKHKDSSPQEITATI